MFWLLVTLLCLLCSCCADERPGIFYNPPTGGKIHDYSENQEYDLGETVQMRWATSLDYFSIMLWQNDNSEYEWIQTNLSDVTSYDWIVSTQRNLDHGTVFFFQIRDATDIANPDRLFASHYFNITKDDSASSSTTSSPTTTRSSSTSITPTIPLTTSSLITTASSDPTGTSSDPPTDSPVNSGLDPQTKVGLGVGISLGGAFLVTLFLVTSYFHRRTARSRSSPYVPNTAAISKDNPPIYTQHLQGPPFEVHGESRGTMRFELPS